MGDSGLLGNFSDLIEMKLPISGGTLEKMDQDIQKILKDSLADVEQTLTRERQLLDTFAAELLQKQELDYDQMEAIFKSFGKMRPSEKK